MAYKNAEDRRKYIRTYYKEKREHCKSILGGKCYKCGSKENLQFDHVEPSSKVFPIGKLMSYSEEDLRKELKKCQLLCGDHHLDKTRSNKENTKNHYKKLNIEQVEEIRFLLNQGEKLRVIGRMFGISHVAVGYIRDGKLWANS